MANSKDGLEALLLVALAVSYGLGLLGAWSMLCGAGLLGC